jgi:hypothetical protein
MYWTNLLEKIFKQDFTEQPGGASAMNIFLGSRDGACSFPEAESKEKHSVWDPMPELPIISLRSRLQHIYNVQPYARVYLNPMPETTLSPS